MGLGVAPRVHPTRAGLLRLQVAAGAVVGVPLLAPVVGHVPGALPLGVAPVDLLALGRDLMAEAVGAGTLAGPGRGNRVVEGGRGGGRARRHVGPDRAPVGRAVDRVGRAGQRAPVDAVVLPRIQVVVGPEVDDQAVLERGEQPARIGRARLGGDGVAGRVLGVECRLIAVGL